MGVGGPTATGAARDVYRRLKDEVESAWQRFDTAANAFQKILKAPDILPPYPDGIQLIRNFNRDYRVAGEEFMKAQKRMAEFTTRGVVPDDLKD
jgi:hypothetical protein